MIDNKKLLGNDNDIFQIKEVLEKSLDNKWTQEFVYLLRKIFLYRILVKCGKERKIYDPDDSRGFKKAFGFFR